MDLSWDNVKSLIPEKVLAKLLPLEEVLSSAISVDPKDGSVCSITTQDPDRACTKILAMGYVESKFGDPAVPYRQFVLPEYVRCLKCESLNECNAAHILSLFGDCRSCKTNLRRGQNFRIVRIWEGRQYIVYHDAYCMAPDRESIPPVAGMVIVSKKPRKIDPNSLSVWSKKSLGITDD